MKRSLVLMLIASATLVACHKKNESQEAPAAQQAAPAMQPASPATKMPSTQPMGTQPAMPAGSSTAAPPPQ